jgi:hypothetical protein
MVDIFQRSLNTHSTANRLVSVSAFSLLFSEIVHNCQEKVNNANDLEEKLKKIGHSIGWRLLNLITLRERPLRRDTTVIGILQFITTVCWRYLFMCETKSLQRSTSNENEYFIYENYSLPNRFISIPKELKGRLNCANFTAGIVRGLLEAARFPATVRAVAAPQSLTGSARGTPNTTTVYVVRFDGIAIQNETMRK